jgi:hypothetical protein
MAATGSEFAATSRAEVVRQLEWLSRQGVVQARDLLNMVTTENYREVWPLIAPLIAQLMTMQQQGARSMMQGYLVATALAAGIIVDALSRPNLTPYVSYRDGRLPSGMPWARLISTVPQAIAHRVENGMSIDQALQASKMTIIGAVNSEAHAEFRWTASDLLDATARSGIEDDLIPEAKVEVRPKDVDKYSVTMQRLIEESKTSDLVDRGDGVYVVRPPRDLDAERFLPGWDPLQAQRPVRWIRQPSANACPWCILQASRGAVFYTRQTATRAGHVHCKCVVFPEPKPGAYRNVILYDPSTVKGLIWKNHRGVEYDVSVFGSQVAQVRTDLRLQPDDFVLTA